MKSLRTEIDINGSKLVESLYLGLSPVQYLCYWTYKYENKNPKSWEKFNTITRLLTVIDFWS